jgi:N6-L-threonylcarbamoyladenine synthase
MKILGIESSCDETAAAIVEDGQILLSNVVASSIDMHKAYGGVVPEIAARSHIESITPVISQALTDASCGWDDIDAIAVTYGPGLGGSLLVGVLSARTLAILHDKPLFAINHVQAHVYAAFITRCGKGLVKEYELSPEKPDFPILALIVSGGHTQLVLFRSHSEYEILGRTADDAVGEAYDKVAKMLGLPYPGGPSVEKLAEKGNAEKFKFPKARTGDEYGFSYSGLKTAVLRAAQQAVGEDYTFPSHQLSGRLSETQKADIAAGFSYAALDALVEKTERAYKACRPKSVVVAGGVSASPALRKMMHERLPIKPFFPDIRLCTDNGAMVAVSGYYQAVHGKQADPKTLDIVPNLSM